MSDPRLLSLPVIDYDNDPEFVRDSSKPHGMVVCEFDRDVKTWAGSIYPPIRAHIEWCVMDRGCREQGDHWSGEGGVSWDGDCPGWVQVEGGDA